MITPGKTVKTRKELTNELEKVKSRLPRLEISLFETTFESPDLPYPPAKGWPLETALTRIDLLEEKLNMILKHLKIEITKQPEQFVITESETCNVKPETNNS